MDPLGFALESFDALGRWRTFDETGAPIEDRVEDLLSQMTLEEKVGLMFHCMIGVPKGPKLDAPISRQSDRRIAKLCNWRDNAAAGQKDKPDA